MSFSTPLALVLLVCVPVVLYLGWPRQRFRRSRDLFSVFLRAAIMLLLVFALAGVQLVRSADRLAVMFLVDVSDSMGQTAQEAALDYVRQSLPRMGPDDQAGLILFGTTALLERPLNNVRELGSILSAPPTGNTDIEKAIRLAMGILPTDAARRIVVLSDGHATSGNAESAAELAAATGIEISYVTFTRDPGPEVQVTQFDAPSTVNAGQDFDLNISIQSEADTAATITVLSSGEIIKRQDYNLRQGTTNLTLPLTGGGSGFKDFQVQVDPVNNDGFYQNNQLSTFSRVVGPPRVLLLYNSQDDIQYILPALQQAGLTVDAMQPSQLPIGLVSLAQYNTIVMANVPATPLPQDRMEAIESFVKDLGGGLVVIGGPNAYGPGAYFETPLEDVLPVNMQVKDQRRLPQLTIAYVIDRSGSMSAVGPSGVENIELAKEAIIRSIDFLQPSDRAGVVSFDSQGYWIANIQQVGDKLPLQRLVATLRTGGGTDILAGMNLVSESIASDPSTRKHIILLTDGGANPAGLVELTRRLKNENDVTTSVIAIGDGLPDFLEEMAVAGGGNFHPVQIVEQIPLIFSQETVLATRSYILEDPFVPTVSATSPIMNGIVSAPPLLGYVATSPKQTAEVILRGPEPYQDPILASWQYGLGRAVAFTSDATSRWGANWVSWDDYVRFWDQTVRWTITEGKSGNVETRVQMEGEQARLIVDARDDGAFLNGLNLQMSVVNPLAKASLMPLRQVAPGRYEATFKPENEGAYILHISGAGQGDNPITVDQTTGWVMSYSSEYDVTGQGEGELFLSGLANLTGGRSLKDDPGLAFAHNLSAQAAATPIWPWFMLVAMVLLPFDIAVRRLVITRTDVQRVRQTLFGRKTAEATSERISTLLGAKERGRLRAEESGSSVAALRARRDESRANQASASAEGDAQPVAKPRFTPSIRPTDPSASPGGNVAGQLLKKRKSREDDKTK
jgi:uncharacterized membrane protein